MIHHHDSSSLRWGCDGLTKWTATIWFERRLLAASSSMSCHVGTFWNRTVRYAARRKPWSCASYVLGTRLACFKFNSVPGLQTDPCSSGSLLNQPRTAHSTLGCMRVSVPLRTCSDKMQKLLTQGFATISVSILLRILSSKQGTIRVVQGTTHRCFGRVCFGSMLRRYALKVLLLRNIAFAQENANPHTYV